MTDTTAAANGTGSTDAGTAPTDSQQTAVDTTTAQPAGTPATTETQQTQAPTVPETYEFQMPDGVELDKAALDDFSGVAKELKLDQATAQKIADIGVKMAQRQQEVFEATKLQWAEQSRTDKEIGGEKFDQNLAVAKKARDAFGSPELKTILDSSGLGNHPEVLKFFFKVGKAISEDGFVPGAPKGAESNDLAKKLFPTMN